MSSCDHMILKFEIKFLSSKFCIQRHIHMIQTSGTKASCSNSHSLSSNDNRGTNIAVTFFMLLSLYWGLQVYFLILNIHYANKANSTINTNLSHRLSLLKHGFNVLFSRDSRSCLRYLHNDASAMFDEEASSRDVERFYRGIFSMIWVISSSNLLFYHYSLVFGSQ